MMPFNTIIIEVEGGCVQDVRNLPEGWSYYTDDADLSPEPMEVASSGIWICPVCDCAQYAPPHEINSQEEDSETECSNCGVSFILVRGDDERLR